MSQNKQDQSNFLNFILHYLATQKVEENYQENHANNIYNIHFFTDI